MSRTLHIALRGGLVGVLLAGATLAACNHSIAEPPGVDAGPGSSIPRPTNPPNAPRPTNPGNGSGSGGNPLPAPPSPGSPPPAPSPTRPPAQGTPPSTPRPPAR